MPRDGWDANAARSVLSRNAPSQASLPLGTPAVRNRLTASEAVDVIASAKRRGHSPEAYLTVPAAQSSGQKLQPDAEGWFTVEIPGEPVPKGRPRFTLITPKGKKPFVSTYTPKETVEYEKRVAAAWQTAGGPFFGNALLELDLLVFERPFKNGNRKRSDGDNHLKIQQDALQPTAFEDDWQIIDARVRKFVDEHNPRTVIRLRKARYE